MAGATRPAGKKDNNSSLFLPCFKAVSAKLLPDIHLTFTRPLPDLHQILVHTSFQPGPWLPYTCAPHSFL
jgi:hypothetical protein